MGRGLPQDPSTRHTRQYDLSPGTDGSLDGREQAQVRHRPQPRSRQAFQGAGSAGHNPSDNLQAGRWRGPQPGVNAFLYCLAHSSVQNHVCADHFTYLTCCRSQCSRAQTTPRSRYWLALVHGLYSQRGEKQKGCRILTHPKRQRCTITMQARPKPMVIFALLEGWEPAQGSPTDHVPIRQEKELLRIVWESV